jgi:hypothetical protein
MHHSPDKESGFVSPKINRRLILVIASTMDSLVSRPSFWLLLLRLFGSFFGINREQEDGRWKRIDERESRGEVVRYLRFSDLRKKTYAKRESVLEFRKMGQSHSRVP